MKRAIVPCLLALVVAVPAGRGEDENPAREALQELNDFVGTWKGAGSNTSRSESWKENAAWGWKFKGDDAWLVVEFKDSKNYSKGELRYDPKQEKYVLKLIDTKGQEREFVGEYKRGYLTLDHVDPKTGETQRLKMNSAGGGVRLVYTFENKPKGSTLFTKRYQVDFSKEGESLAGGGKKRECVVTGGEGTIPVSYKGMTYYVCCSGCRDAFNENPEKILKEYEERKKKK